MLKAKKGGELKKCETDVGYRRQGGTQKFRGGCEGGRGSKVTDWHFAGVVLRGVSEKERICNCGCNIKGICGSS